MKVYVCWVGCGCQSYPEEMHKQNIVVKKTEEEVKQWLEQTKKLSKHLEQIAYSFGGERAYYDKMVERFGKERYDKYLNKHYSEPQDPEIMKYHRQLYKEDEQRRWQILRDNGYGAAAWDSSFEWLQESGYDELELVL